MKRPYKFYHLEIRRFPRSLEIACFDKVGRFRWAFYLPSFHLLTRKKFMGQIPKEIMKEVDDGI